MLKGKRNANVRQKTLSAVNLSLQEAVTEITELTLAQTLTDFFSCFPVHAKFLKNAGATILVFLIHRGNKEFIDPNFSCFELCINET